MERSVAHEFAWSGLNTRAPATGLPLLDCVELQDLRVVGTDLLQRYGIYGIGQLTGDFSAMDFDDVSSEHCSNTVDTRAWDLGLYFSVEFAIELDVATGTQGIVTVAQQLVRDESKQLVKPVPAGTVLEMPKRLPSG